MAVTPYGDVGIVSNPDARPADPTTTDNNPRNITLNTTGRKPIVATRDNDPNKPAGNS